MKTLLFTLIALFGINLAFAQNSKIKMGPAQWQEDLEYLDKKIKQSFATFNPEVKKAYLEKTKELHAAIPHLQDHEIGIGMMAALAQLKDGHTEINVGKIELGFRRLPFVLKFFEEGLFVINAHAQHKDLLGAQILQIGNLSTEEVFKRLQKIMSHDNEMEFWHAGPGYMLLAEVLEYLDVIEQMDEIRLTVKPLEGEKYSLNIASLSYQKYVDGPWLGLLKEQGIESPLYLQNSRQNYWFQYLEEEKTLYFHFRRVNNQKGQPSIAKFTKALFKEIDARKPEKLIIDFRHNNGGNYNLSTPLVKGIGKRPWLNQKGKVWAITGWTTFSASSSTCIFLKQQTNTQLIGEPGRTHPNLADNNEYLRLPNSNILVEYTTKIKKHWPELGDLDHIPVDVEMKTSFKAYQKGADPILAFLLK